MLKDVIDFLLLICLLNVAVLLTTASMVVLKIMFQDPRRESHEGELPTHIQ